MEEWKAVYKRYISYPERFPEENQILGGDIPDLPIQSAARGDSMISYVGDNEGPLERELLLEYNSEAPDIPDLETKTLERLSLGLTEVLRVQVTADHMRYWSHTLEILRESENADIDDEFLELIEWLIALTRTTSSGFIGSSEKWSEGWAQEKILSNSNTIAGYVSHPVFEGFLKEICSREVTREGKVRPGKSVETLTGTITGDEEGGQKVLNIGDYLYHIESVKADDGLSNIFHVMREHVANFYDWDVDEVYGNEGLTGLRNASLHGEEQAKSEYGIMLNYMSLIGWGAITGSL